MKLSTSEVAIARTLEAQDRLTPTVVNTSCSLFTKVISWGSLTLILFDS